MTCAEARRQLSAPDAARAAEIDAHLEDCAPCRGESESLKEVDRRIMRLGEVRRGVARAAYSRDPALGRAPMSSPHFGAGVSRSVSAPAASALAAAGSAGSGLVAPRRPSSSPSPLGDAMAPAALPPALSRPRAVIVSSQGGQLETPAQTTNTGRTSLVFFALAVVIALPVFLWLLFRVRH